MIQFLFTIIFFLLTLNSFEQLATNEKIEHNLVKDYSNILKFSDHNNDDSLVYYDSVFRNAIKFYTQHYPSTISYPFKNLGDSIGLDIVSSEDSLFRIYSWDTWSGGTMHFFNNVFQFKSGKHVYSKLLFDSTDEGDPLSYFSKIYTLKINNTTYYLCISNGKYSTKDASQSIQMFCIDNNNLNDSARLIKTSSGFTNNITIEYDFFSGLNAQGNRLKLINYDSNQKIIFIPIVLNKGKVTNRFIKYQFTGKYFEQIKHNSK